MAKRDFAPIHPGEILKAEFMEPYNLSARNVAERIGLPHHNRISEIVNGSRGITSDTAIRLEKLFGFSAQAWLNLQYSYELETALIDAEADDTIKAIEKFEPVAA